MPNIFTFHPTTYYRSFLSSGLIILSFLGFLAFVAHPLTLSKNTAISIFHSMVLRGDTQQLRSWETKQRLEYLMEDPGKAVTTDRRVWDGRQDPRYTVIERSIQTSDDYIKKYSNFRWLNLDEDYCSIVDKVEMATRIQRLLPLLLLFNQVLFLPFSIRPLTAFGLKMKVFSHECFPISGKFDPWLPSTAAATDPKSTRWRKYVWRRTWRFPKYKLPRRYSKSRRTFSGVC